MSFESGILREGLYEILETFGGGGMGLVHRARHRTWNIEVAIKHPRREIMDAPKQIASFYSECLTWAEIGMHPYVATCFYSRELDGLPCVVAEYLPGGSLQDAIHSRKLYKGDEDASLAGMLTIAASTAWGLARAHESGLIHCDVKPGNMLLTSHGVAKVSDFGLAIRGMRHDGELRQDWMTKEFAAPEQIRCESLTPAVDVWGWAASMLAMFTGGVTWESGVACGAVLNQFLEDGGKAYRIPPMPEPVAELLGECFRAAPEARISAFSQIAKRICQCHEELFGEPCAASKPDLELISADSLNNRAVSRYDLGDIPGVQRLLGTALTGDPLHPEANFNLALLGYFTTQRVSQKFLDRLEQVTHFDLGECRPWLYRACLLSLEGRPGEAFADFGRARDLAGPHEISEFQRLWDLSTQHKVSLVLACPTSGEDFAYDFARFERLMAKAEAAIVDNRLEDAKRYLIMSGDIGGFGRHPRRSRLSERLERLHIK